MTHSETVSVKCWIISWMLWSAAGGLLAMATLHALVINRERAAIELPLVVIGWALYVVTAAAVWTVQRELGAKMRRLTSKSERLERRLEELCAMLERRVEQENGVMSHHATTLRHLRRP